MDFVNSNWVSRLHKLHPNCEMNKVSSVLFGAFLLILCGNVNSYGDDGECGVLTFSRRMDMARSNVLVRLPWHANIYRKSDDKFEYVCGGAIVNKKVVVTARGCFKNLTNGQEYDSRDYIVSVGKFYREFDNSFDSENNQQNFNVSAVTYREGPNFYEDNIAAVTLDSEIVWIDEICPLCLNDNSQIENSGKTRGVVGHFGDVVKKNQCKRKLPSAIHRFFKTEQRCLKNEVEPNYVRHTVAGEALAMGVERDGKVRYYLKGVISKKYTATKPGRTNRGDELMIVTNAVPSEQFIKANFV